MISGTVFRFQASVDLTVGDPAGQHGEVRFALDTGFIGDITLPSAACAALGFRYLRPQPVSLADGSRVVLDVYEGTLVWDGATRAVEVLAADGTPLLGMTLLDRKRTSR